MSTRSIWRAMFAFFSFVSLAFGAQAFAVVSLLNGDVSARSNEVPSSGIQESDSITFPPLPSSAAFAFDAFSTLTTCSSGIIRWTYSGPSTSMSLTISRINILQQLSSRARGHPIILSDTINTSSGLFVWSPVNVPDGWYTLNATIPLVSDEEQSTQFFVHRGRNASCLGGGSSATRRTRENTVHVLLPRSTTAADQAGLPILIAEIAGVVLLVVTALVLFWHWELRKKRPEQQDIETPSLKCIVEVKQRRSTRMVLEDPQLLEGKPTQGHRALRSGGSSDGVNVSDGSADTESIIPHSSSTLPSPPIRHHAHKSKARRTRYSADVLSIPGSAVLAPEAKRLSITSLTHSTAPSRASSSILSTTAGRYYSSHFSATLDEDRKGRHTSSLSFSTHNIQPSRASSISSSKNVYLGPTGGGASRRGQRKSNVSSPEIYPPLPVHNPSAAMLLRQKTPDPSTDSLNLHMDAEDRKTSPCSYDLEGKETGLALKCLEENTLQE